MNIAVFVKHAVDEGELRADASGKPALKGAATKMSTFDRNAVEEAVKAKEVGGGAVTVITLGAPEAKKSVKEALAMGCDKALLLLSTRELDLLATSYYLSRAVKRAGPFDSLIFAEGASDTYDGMVGPMVAEWLGFPFLGYARKLEFGAGRVRAEVALDENTEIREADLPAVVSVVSEINSPRYPTLLQIMQTSKKPIEEISLDSLKDEAAPTTTASFAEVTAQALNRKKTVFEGPAAETAQKLLDALRREGVI